MALYNYLQLEPMPGCVMCTQRSYIDTRISIHMGGRHSATHGQMRHVFTCFVASILHRYVHIRRRMQIVRMCSCSTAVLCLISHVYHMFITCSYACLYNRVCEHCHISTRAQARADLLPLQNAAIWQRSRAWHRDYHCGLPDYYHSPFIPT